MCKPSQSKYYTAVMVALGVNADAIVVDTKETAAACIKYMQDQVSQDRHYEYFKDGISQRIGVASFLPLNHITPVEINERLRSIGGEKTRLCIDIAQPIEEGQSIERAIQFAVGNTIVCETMAEARLV